ncbi:serine acetyltransferase [Aggregicoccus sp. 17bor-14]|uniref:serine O-acetyltransferase EpsC n=1 Tax=Myxococcaceae TaxID=31 RepID=UPI00129D1F3E|nr:MULTISPECIES: serine O-acetyltransferase EpsC [Myxococcaceae]MBF5042603.1 serine acetyltransferase [Simulacricoccus sp. 17bor-14]MRI88371.1 serine acetyltransferase [Aggregicoccus sp. 17bor-14]
MLRQLYEDAVQVAQCEAGGSPDARQVLRTLALSDGYTVLALQRVRAAARLLPGANRILRLAQTALYGIEIGKDVTLGKGVYFVHTLGIVIGGDARIGDRVRFMGNNTVGTAKDNGYPTLEEDVVVGCGARILGPIRVGARSVIGANAVVLHDVPPDSVVTGIPAKAQPKGARDPYRTARSGT